jgi:hypothetical protein
VFFARSDVSTFSRRQSGRMDEKMLACFTCPAMISSVSCSSLRISISRLSWPMDTQ